MTTLIERIRAFRDDAAKRDPHGPDHQVADIFLAEAQELAATRDAGRWHRLITWAAAKGLASPASGREVNPATTLATTPANGTGRAALLVAADAVGRYRGREPTPRHLTTPSGTIVYEPTLTETAFDRFKERYRGAPMGKPDYTAPDVTPQDTLHFTLSRVPLDDGGYAPDGVYWGLPRGTLWRATADVEGSIVVSRWFRAPSHAHADATVRDEFKNATTQRVSWSAK